MRSPNLRSALLAAVFAFSLLESHGGASASGPAATAPDSVPRPAKVRGVSWVGGPDPVGREHLAPLPANGVDWIVQTPFGWQERADSPAVRLATGGRVWWGESDEGLLTTARLAHELGIQTLLKPHIWLRDGHSGKGPLDICMKSPADWERWFASYRGFILHYARLAEAAGIEALAVGTELRNTVREREADWRALIAEVRRVYRGKLTYAANWYREFEEVRFWDQLDAIGIQAYFPLAENPAPSLEALRRGWVAHLPAIEAVQRRYAKPVVFTELGYRSAPEAPVRPWEWPEHAGNQGGDLGERTQADAYQAFFETFWNRDWFAGVFFWKWYPRAGAGPITADFTPQHKPAEAIMRSWFSGSLGAER